MKTITQTVRRISDQRGEEYYWDRSSGQEYRLIPEPETFASNGCFVYHCPLCRGRRKLHLDRANLEGQCLKCGERVGVWNGRLSWVYRGEEK